MALVHGVGMDHSAWRFQTRALAHAGFAVIAPDLPGHGSSPGPPLTSIEAMAEWTVGMMAALGVERAALVGHSMGSLVALEAAARRPELVQAVALLATAERMEVRPELQAAARDHDRRAVDLMVGWSHTGKWRMGGHPQPGSWVRATSRRLFEHHLDGVLAVDLEACSGYAGPSGPVSCPALVVVGSADKMTPAEGGRALAARLPDARLEVLEGTGHMSILEQPDEVRRLLEGFLAETMAGPAVGR